ncbi:MAG: translation elongation factor Ts [Clostridia bacterium]|nr:translation elongation factor Ts [Clostridia bacterium]
MFTAKDVAELRNMTGVGMMECKKALTEANGDKDKAVELLREKGMAAAAKKASRIAAEGIVDSYIHLNGSVGVLLEMNCESDFVAQSPAFKALSKDICLQIAAAKPLVVNEEDLDKALVESEAEIYRAQALNEGKPAQIVEKMVEGRIQKYYKEVCLMDQPFIKDDSKTIRDVINEAIQKIGEKITIRRFVRYEMGEGLQKRNDDFAAEVAAQAKKN